MCIAHLIKDLKSLHFFVKLIIVLQMSIRKILIGLICFSYVVQADVEVDFSYPHKLLGSKNPTPFRDICKNDIFPAKCVEGNKVLLASPGHNGLKVVCPSQDVADGNLSGLFKRCIRYVRENYDLNALEHYFYGLNAEQVAFYGPPKKMPDSCVFVDIKCSYLIIGTSQVFVSDDYYKSKNDFIKNSILAKINEDCVECLDKVDLGNEKCILVLAKIESPFYDRSEERVKDVMLLPIGFTSKDGRLANSILDIIEEDVDKICSCIEELLKKYDLFNRGLEPSITFQISKSIPFHISLVVGSDFDKKREEIGLPANLTLFKVKREFLGAVLPKEGKIWETSERAKEVSKRLKMYYEEDKKRLQKIEDGEKGSDEVKSRPKEIDHKKQENSLSENINPQSDQAKQHDNGVKSESKKDHYKKFLPNFMQNWSRFMTMPIGYILFAFYSIFVYLPSKFFYLF